MSSILYYITGHGYGHAVRSSQVIRALLEASPDVNIHVRTMAPEWLFHDSSSRVSHSDQSIDTGIIQKDSLDMDLGETLRACQALHETFPEILAQELTFVRDHQIRLVVGDIPPLCFEIATRAGIPSVAITNFTWDRIYRAYVLEYPRFAPLIDEMGSFYRKATLALALPFPCGMEIFPHHETIPWIARTSSLTQEEARTRFELPKSATIVLLSFGGLGLDRLPWDRLQKLREYFFVATGVAQKRNGNILILPDNQRQYVDLLRAVDMIVTKPGYGIVADVIAQQVPMLYTDRGEFAEYPLLVQALSELATAEFIAQTELLSGNIEPYLTRLLSKERNWPSVGLDGANVAADRILGIFDG